MSPIFPRMARVSWLVCLAAGLVGAQTTGQTRPAGGNPVHTAVVVDSNPAVFAAMAGLTAAGYGSAPTPAEAATPAGKLRAQLRAELTAQTVPAAQELKNFFQTHHRGNANQDVAQYITLALFLGNPPGLTLTVPEAGLPPEAVAVDDVLPILQRFYTQAKVDALWQQAEPNYDLVMSGDVALARKSLTAVDAFFRIPASYSPRQFFIFPDPLLMPGQSDALNYEDNYYIVVNLDAAQAMAQIRHTYLHFLLDPIIAQYPAAITPMEQQIMPLVAKAAGLDVQFRRDAQLLFTECLVRAVEIQLDPGTDLQKQAAVQAAMKQGLVLTPYWFDQLASFRLDPAGFAEFYPVAAFAARWDEISAAVKHTAFSPAPPAEAPAPLEARPAPGLLDLGQARLDAHDLPAATALAQAALQQPRGDHATAYYLLGKIAIEQSQVQGALDDFQNALRQTGASAHIKTWSNIYLARLSDAENLRSTAVNYYKAALLTADTPLSKSVAEAGLKAPFQPKPAKAH